MSSFGADELRTDSLLTTDITATGSIVTAGLQSDALVQANPNGGQDITPRGIGPQFVSTVNNGPHADLAVTDMVLNNVPVIAGHLLRFRVHTEVTISAVISTWILTFNVNGVVVDRFGRIDHLAAVIRTYAIDATCTWLAPATLATDDFAVGIDETTATAATATLAAAATNRRRFEVEDLGTTP